MSSETEYKTMIIIIPQPDPVGCIVFTQKPTRLWLGPVLGRSVQHQVSGQCVLDRQVGLGPVDHIRGDDAEQKTFSDTGNPTSSSIDESWLSEASGKFGLQNTFPLVLGLQPKKPHIAGVR